MPSQSQPARSYAIMTPSMSLTTMSNSATCKWPPLLEIPPDDNMCTTATP